MHGNVSSFDLKHTVRGKIKNNYLQCAGAQEEAGFGCDYCGHLREKKKRERDGETKLTVSEPAAVTNSCKARTESACSMTKTHCERSGGIFLSAMFSKKQCRLPNPSAAKQTRSPVAVHERHTMSS